MKHTAQIIISFFLLTLIGSAACQSASALGPSQILQLATSTENYVDVSITLERRGNDRIFLSATFTPLNSGLHLYSKEIPKTGLDGLGRPTLLELSKDSSIKVVSKLLESTSPQRPTSPPLDLLTYPAGPVTLSYQILLPEGSNWIEDEVIVTYMACNDLGCRPPIQQKPIAIKIPGQALFH